MKITISYLQEEQERADAVERYVLGAYHGVRVRKNYRPPFKHTYLAVKNQQGEKNRD